MRKKAAYAFMLGITLTTVGAMIWVPGEQARQVRTVPVQIRRMEERVDGAGLLGRVQEHAVSTLSGGQVAEMFVTSREQVRQGQALFRLDSTTLEQSLVALLQGRDSEVTLRASALEEIGSVWEDGSQWVLQAQDQRTQQQVEALQRQIAACTVRALTDGEVLATYVRAGEVALPGAPVLAMAQATQVVRVQVGEREALRLQTGMEARFLRDDQWLGEGVVLSVGLPQMRADGVLTSLVELVPNAPIDLPAGARLDVEILCAVQEGASLVPVEALDEDESRVWQVYERRAWPVAVRTGLQDALQVAVQGIPEDAVIIVSPPGDLKEGQLVEVMAP